MANSVVHFEIPAGDLARARRFYSDAFGWEITPMPGMEDAYLSAGTTAVGENMMPLKPGAINGGIFPIDKPFTGPVITIDVDDMATALERVEAAGGKKAQEPQRVGDMGIAGYFTDPEGNLMGLWQSL